MITMLDIAYWVLLIPICIAYASFGEWLLHREVMHKPIRFLMYPYDAHTRTHHVVFRSDSSYHLQRKEDKSTIPMAWWNWIVLIAILSILPALVSWGSGKWSITIVAAGIGAAYYGAHEYLHMCMHLPRPQKLRLVEKSWIFYKLNGHHLLHHRCMGKNFNVVLPLADWLFGTLLSRAPSPFAQPRGPMIPNVQPIPKPVIVRS